MKKLALLAGVLLCCSCTISPLPRASKVESPGQALEEARIHADEGRWSEAITLLDAAHKKFPEDATVAMEEQRVRADWDRLKARMEDQLLLIRGRSLKDEISVLEPLVTAEPHQFPRAWSLERQKQALNSSRDALLGCTERQIDHHLSLATNCLELSEEIKVDEKSQRLREEVERREAKHETVEASIKAKRAARSAANKKRQRAKSVRREKQRLDEQIQRAEQLLTEGQYAEASEEIDKVLAEAPDNARALGLRTGLDQILERQQRVLGELAARLYTDGELDAAIQVWESLLAISPDHAETQDRLDRAKRVRDKLNQFREQQQQQSDGGEAAAGSN